VGRVVVVGEETTKGREVEVDGRVDGRVEEGEE
jgi:hypothetical protein